MLRRYILFQLPELVLGGLALFGLVRLELISATLGWGLFVAWVLKEAALYPLLRRSYAPSPSGGAEALVGGTARVTSRIRPGETGMVRLGAELWRADLVEGAEPVDVGAVVRVEAVNGLTLSVIAIDGPGGS